MPTIIDIEPKIGLLGEVAMQFGVLLYIHPCSRSFSHSLYGHTIYPAKILEIALYDSPGTVTVRFMFHLKLLGTILDIIG